MKPILILKTGNTLPPIAERRGDFELWIREGMAIVEERIRVVEAHEDERPDAPGAYGGVVVTGSPAMVSDREEWSERAGRWLLDALDQRVPILGICYGHQLLAQALGGVVGPNPNGREIGTVEVRFGAEAADDPLLGVAPATAPFHTSHVESVIELPAGARRLATTDLDPNHVFAIGDAAWGVQFHPEFDADITRRYIAGRRAQIEAEDLDADALTATVRDTPDAGPLLQRFAALSAET